MKILVTIGALLFLSFRSPAEDVITYKQLQGGKTIVYDVTITRLGDTYQFITSRDEGKIRHEAITDLAYATRNFSFSNSEAGTNYTAVRENDRIVISGQLKNKETNSELAISSEPWYQFLEEPLGAFASSSESSMKFWTLEPEGLQLGELEAVREGTEDIVVNEKTVHANKIRISLTGLFSGFWHADYWFDADKGSYLRCETTTGPGGEKIIIELNTP